MSSSNFVPSAYLVMTNVDPADWCATFTPDHKIIGRDLDAPIPIPQRFALVSRKHAEIWADQKSLKLRDVGSKAGTRVNDVWLNQHKDTSLVIGDRIWMGGVEFQVTDQIPLIAQVLAENFLPGTGVEGTQIHSIDGTQQDLPAASPPLSSDAIETDPLARSTEFGTRVLPPSPIRILLAGLSHAELEVVLWMGRGYLDDNELGEKLFRSPNTVRTHLSNIFRKLNVHSRAEVIGRLKRMR